MSLCAPARHLAPAWGLVPLALLLTAAAPSAVHGQEVPPVTGPSQLHPDAQDAVILLDLLEKVEERYRSMVPSMGAIPAAEAARDWAARQPSVTGARLDGGGTLLHLELRSGLTGSVQFEFDPLKD